MRRFVAFLVLLTCILPTAAWAYIPSPRYGAFELKFGPYRPAVDNNDSLDGTPYKDLFGDDSLFLTVLELDWQFVHLTGINFGVGGSLGFMQAYTKSKLLDEEGNVTEEDSADYTVLNIMPFALLAVIRVDALSELLNVPLVPFFKIGLNWYLWWILGGGDVAEYEYEDENGETHKERGVGGTLGWQFSTGIMFQLDSFDRMAARTFDNEVGVNNSYIFAEFLWAFVDKFGDGDYMNLSTDNFGGATFLGGVCLEF